MPRRTTRCGRTIQASLMLLILALQTGCEPTEPARQAPPAATEPEMFQPARLWPDYYALAQHHADASRDCINQLYASVVRLLDDTREEHLKLAREQLDHCIDKQSVIQGLRLGTTSAQAELIRLQQRLFTRVTYPGFIDALQLHPYSGIVQDSSLALDRMTLEQQHGVTDSSEVSLGLDVLGFLLEGEHRYQASLPLRTYTELTAPSADQSTATDADHPLQRRRTYLALAAEIARDDARKQAALWQRESTRSPTAEHWTHWVNRLVERQQRVLGSALISGYTLRHWWAVWHQPLGEGDAQRSLATFLAPWDQRSSEQERLKTLMDDPATEDSVLREHFTRWLLADTTTSQSTAH